jgi:hypothetical protein
LAKYRRPSIAWIRAFPTVEQPQLKVMPVVAAATATFALFVESKSDIVSSSLKPSDRLFPSLSLALAPKPSWLDDTVTPTELWFIDESTSANSWEATVVASRWTSPLVGHMVLFDVSHGKAKRVWAPKAKSKSQK